MSDTPQSAPGREPGPPTRRGNTNTSQSVDRAMAAFFALAEHGPQRHVDLVELTGLDRRILGRLLASLEKAGLVRRRTPTGFYDLGAALPRLGRLAEERLALPRVATEHLHELMARTSCTVLLHMRQDDHLAPVVVLSPPGVLSVSYPIGRRIELQEGLGRAFLACLPETEQRRIADEAAWPALRRVSAAIRRDGYAVSRSEIVVGITAVGAPVRGGDDQPIGLVALVAVEGHQPERFGRDVAATAAKITEIYRHQ
jgi:DNA-binding IclR family transcriptional regulator